MEPTQVEVVEPVQSSEAVTTPSWVKLDATNKQALQERITKEPIFSGCALSDELIIYPSLPEGGVNPIVEAHKTLLRSATIEIIHKEQIPADVGIAIFNSGKSNLLCFLIRKGNEAELIRIRDEAITQSNGVIQGLGSKNTIPLPRQK